MSTTEGLWVAYGDGGVVGTIRKDAGEYIVTLADADAALGRYPTMDVAKNALHAQLTPGTDWPQFRQH